ncbi:MAG TPA: alpha/beta fold hydrolase [Anaerolineae bacterium]|nr:alpha/beta fold hydrolase [Anaerolineae bacterium]
MTKLRVSDMDLYYETFGQGDPMVLIHGLGSSSRDWEGQIGYFSRQYQVIAVDIRGHGRSDKPAGPYSIPLFTRDMAEMIRALDLAPVHVVGISLGGMIALQLAVDEPELVRSLVVVNSGSEMVVRTIKDRIGVWQRTLIVRLMGMRKMGEVLGGRLFPEPEQHELRNTFADRWAENDPKAYLEAMKAIVGWSVTEQLHRIACPTLVIAAEHDYTPIEVKSTLAGRIDGAECVVIENSRHGSPVDQPEAFNKVLSAFLARNG